MTVVKTDHWYPEHIKDIEEYQNGVIPAYDKELTLAWDDRDNVMGDRFISTMSADECAAWEKMLGIRSYAGESLEERRAEIKVRCLSSLPFTSRKLDEILKTMFGADGYQLEIFVDEYGVKITLQRDFVSDVDTLMKLVRQIVPANMTLQIIVAYNRWIVFEPRTWGDIYESTWHSIYYDDSWTE